MATTSEVKSLSILSPVFNEEENIETLVNRLRDALTPLGLPYEIIFVDDGSTDRSFELLAKSASQFPELKLIRFRRNHGQTAAMMAAIDHATGDVIIPIDADMQNDPNDIPKLLDKLAEGFDVVSGWRANRQDAKFRRVFVSRLANKLISWVSGVHLHDYGCTLKAYRSSVIKDVRLYGEMHRFIPIYATWQGAKCTELPVNHFPRVHGQSKYGINRTFKVILDLIVVMFLDKYFTKPIYLFGGFAMLFLLMSGLSGFAALYLKFFHGYSFINTPLPLLTVMGFITGIMSMLMGLLAEILVRTYFESQNKPAYLVQDTINVEPTDG